MSYLELFRLISTPWLGTKEIMRVANCGRDRAIQIRNMIETQIIKEGKILPQGKTILVPTRKVIELLDLDLNYICSMAQQELNLNKNDRSVNYASLSR